MERQTQERVIAAPGPNAAATLYFNGYLRTILAGKTGGSILNLGAGSASRIFGYDRVLPNTEYHTLEPAAVTNPTYVADIQNMPSVPSGYYDWVLSIAVLEHVPDMAAAASEIARVTKPGGHIFMSIPARFEQHWEFGYWDYWRVTTFGMIRLFEPEFAIREIEYWGDSVVDPVSISVIAQRGGVPGPITYRLYEIDGGYDRMTTYVDGDAPFLERMRVWRLRVRPEEYAGKVSELRRTFFQKSGGNLTTAIADRQLRPELATLESMIVISNSGAQLIRL